MDSDKTRALHRYNNDKTWEYLPASIYIITIAILGVLGNSLAIAFYGQKKKKTMSTVLLLVVSINDLLTSIALTDMTITLCYTVTFTNLLGCQFVWFINHTLVSNSVCFLLILAIERFMLVYLNKRLTKMSIAFIITAMVISNLSLSIRDFWIVDTVPVNITLEKNVTIVGYHCTHTGDQALRTTIQLFHLIDLIETVGLFSALFVLYMLIATKIYKSRQKLQTHNNKKLRTHNTPSDVVFNVSVTTCSAVPSDEISPEKDELKLAAISNRVTRQRSETRITKMVFAIIVGSVVSFVPYFVAHLLVPYRFDRPLWVVFARRSIILNSAVNPYIMGYFNIEFREYIVRKLACMKCRN